MKIRSFLAAAVVAGVLAGAGPVSALDFNMGAFGTYYNSDDAGDAWCCLGNEFSH